ncbi:unnamed protein product [Chrysoparadoxa australica]
MGDIPEKRPSQVQQLISNIQTLHSQAGSGLGEGLSPELQAKLAAFEQRDKERQEARAELLKRLSPARPKANSIHSAASLPLAALSPPTSPAKGTLLASQTVANRRSSSPTPAAHQVQNRVVASPRALEPLSPRSKEAGPSTGNANNVEGQIKPAAATEASTDYGASMPGVTLAPLEGAEGENPAQTSDASAKETAEKAAAKKEGAGWEGDTCDGEGDQPRKQSALPALVPSAAEEAAESDGAKKTSAAAKKELAPQAAARRGSKSLSPAPPRRTSGTSPRKLSRTDTIPPKKTRSSMVDRVRAAPVRLIPEAASRGRRKSISDLQDATRDGNCRSMYRDMMESTSGRTPVATSAEGS